MKAIKIVFPTKYKNIIILVTNLGLFRIVKELIECFNIYYVSVL